MSEILNFAAIDNLWKALTFVICFAVAAAVWALTNRTKKDADDSTESTAKVLEATERAEEKAAQSAAWAERVENELMPAVENLSGEVSRLRREVEAMTPIVRIKYPLALDHISTLHTAEPELTARFPIPRTLREDMEE